MNDVTELVHTSDTLVLQVVPGAAIATKRHRLRPTIFSTESADFSGLIVLG